MNTNDPIDFICVTNNLEHKKSDRMGRFFNLLPSFV